MRRTEALQGVRMMSIRRLVNWYEAYGLKGGGLAPPKDKDRAGGQLMGCPNLTS